MDNERYELEKELFLVDKKLEKEKSKRNIIMILLSSIICGLVCTAINDNFDSFTDIIFLIIMSVVFGTILYFVAISAFAAVTDLFTDIPHLKDRKSALEEKLNKIILNGK